MTIGFAKSVLRMLIVSHLVLLPAYAQTKCDEPIRNTVWRALGKPITSEMGDCRKVLGVSPIKLGTGSAFIVRGRGDFCGATGNCSTWIVERRVGRFRLILNVGSVLEGPSKSRERGHSQYPDIAFRFHFSATEYYLGTFSFARAKYRLKSCAKEFYDGKKIRSTTQTDLVWCQF